MSAPVGAPVTWAFQVLSVTTFSASCAVGASLVLAAFALGLVGISLQGLRCNFETRKSNIIKQLQFCKALHSLCHQPRHRMCVAILKGIAQPLSHFRGAELVTFTMLQF